MALTHRPTAVLKIPTYGVGGTPWLSMLGAPPGKVDACIVPDRVSHTASEAATREAAMVQPFPPPAWPTGQEVDPRRWIAEHL